jgi:predicted aspartyl protease
MKKTSLKIHIVKLNNLGVHLLIKPKVNGKTVCLLIDTGASNTVFDKKQIAPFIGGAKLKELSKMSTGLGTSSMQSHSVKLEKLELGDLVILDYKTMVLDLSHVNTSYESIKKKAIDGVLGGDILKKYHAVIDYKAKLLTMDVFSGREKTKTRKKKPTKKKGI